MKKNILTIIGILIIFIVIGIIIYMVAQSKQTDEIKFKNEYESLNGEKNENGKTYVKTTIPKKNNVEYLEFDEVMEFLESGTGILYFGFPECPWCRNAIPVLIDVAKESETKIYYYNALPIRDIKELDKDGNIKTTKQGTEDYYKLIDKLKDYLPAYEGLNDESIKRLYFPTVVFVMGGKVVATHEGTVDSQKNPYKVLTSKQTKELKEIYEKDTDKIYGICDDSC